MAEAGRSSARADSATARKGIRNQRITKFSAETALGRSLEPQGRLITHGHEHDREINPKHPADFEDVIADKDEKDALRQGEDAKGNGFGKNIVRQPDIEIAFPLQNNPIADDVIGAVGQAEEHV